MSPSLDPRLGPVDRAIVELLVAAEQLGAVGLDVPTLHRWLPRYAADPEAVAEALDGPLAAWCATAGDRFALRDQLPMLGGAPIRALRAHRLAARDLRGIGKLPFIEGVARVGAAVLGALDGGPAGLALIAERGRRAHAAWAAGRWLALRGLAGDYAVVAVLEAGDRPTVVSVVDALFWASATPVAGAWAAAVGPVRAHWFPQAPPVENLPTLDGRLAAWRRRAGATADGRRGQRRWWPEERLGGALPRAPEPPAALWADARQIRFEQLEGSSAERPRAPRGPRWRDEGVAGAAASVPPAVAAQPGAPRAAALGGADRARAPAAAEAPTAAPAGGTGPSAQITLPGPAMSAVGPRRRGRAAVEAVARVALPEGRPSARLPGPGRAAMPERPPRGRGPAAP